MRGRSLVPNSAAILRPYPIPWTPFGRCMTRQSPAFLAAPVLAALALVAGPAAAQKAISPGYWETTSKVTGIPLVAPKTERRCIQPAQASRRRGSPAVAG